MYCDNCGIKLPDDAKFCAGCGAKVEAQPAYAAVKQTEDPAAPLSPAPSPSDAPPVQPPPAPNRSAYAPPTPQSAAPAGEVLGVGQYIGIFLLMGIPILRIILLFKWGFGRFVNPNKRNFARAALILFLVALLISVAIAVSYGDVLWDLFSGSGGYR